MVGFNVFSVDHVGLFEPYKFDIDRASCSTASPPPSPPPGLDHLSMDGNLACQEFCSQTGIPIPSFVKFNKKQLPKQQMSQSVLTTVMIRHIACRYTQEQAMQCLNDAGLEGKYDMVYLPLNPSRRANLGYLFVNFVDVEGVDDCKRIFTGKAFGASASTKRCEVSLAHIQGKSMLAAHSKKTKNRSGGATVVA